MTEHDRVFRTCVCGLFVLLAGLVASGADPLSVSAVRAAIVPQADLFVSVDAEGWNGTPIQKTIDALRDEMDEGELPPGVLRAQAHMERALETLGITKEDVSGFVFSAHLQGITDAGVEPTSPVDAMQRLSCVACFALAKPVEMAGIKGAVNRAAAEEGWEVMFEKDEYKGAETLSIVTTGNEPAQNPMGALGGELSLALVEGGTIVYVGLAPHVRASVDRWAGKQTADFVPAIAKAKEAVLEKALTVVLFVPGDKMRNAAKERAAKMQQQNPMVAGALQSIGGMQHVAFGMSGTDRIAARLSADFGSAQEAVQVKSVVDMMGLSMLKMAMMQALGRPIPLLESLGSTQDGNRVALNAEVTEEDCRALVELRAKQMRRQGGAPPPPAPAVPAN